MAQRGTHGAARHHITTARPVRYRRRHRGADPVDLSGWSGWSGQYASSSGTTYQVTELSGTVAAGDHYLVQESAGSGGTTPLPTPDATGSISMSAPNGKVALALGSSALTCATGCADAAGVRDFVGYGSANDFEGDAAAPGLSNSTAATRNAARQDTDRNGADFTVAEPAPQASGADGEPEPPVPTANIGEIQGAAHRSTLEGEAVSDVAGVVTQRTGNGFWMQDPTPDDDIATSEGIFVFTRSTPVAELTRGRAVSVSGTVSEFRPGGDTNANLSITQIAANSATAGADVGLPAATVVGPDGRTPPGAIIEDDSQGNVELDNTFDPAEDGIDFWESMEGMRVRVQAPEVVGPTSRFDELPVVTAEASVRTVRDGVVLRGDESPSVDATDDPIDANPERVIVDVLSGTSMPSANVGDTLSDDATGVLDYSFGNFKLYVDRSPEIVDGGIKPETTTLDGLGGRALTVATYNVENLDPSDPADKFTALAEGIVDNLGAPDVVTLEEVQDNTGSTDDGTVAANETLDQLVAAIQAAGGPAYDWRQINPRDKSDGGEPGGNIRVAFLFRSDRGLQFVDRGATTAAEVVGTGSDTRLSLSNGRVAPTSSAWSRSRQPLAGEFSWQGRTVFVIANHFASKGGDDPLFGRFQPPRRSAEEQRHEQARVLRDFVDDLLAADPQARVAVAGDINDFEFSQTVDLLVGSGSNALTDLPRTLPQPERYTYVFDGNSQVLDHILVSPALEPEVTRYDIVHTNAEFAAQVSDHDPQLAQLGIDGPEDTTLTLSVDPRQVTFRDEVTLSGALSDGTDEGTGGREIVIKATTAAGTEVVAQTTTRADGTYSVQLSPRENTVYRARYAGGVDDASRSESASVSVAPVVKAFPSDDEIKHKDTLQVAGVVAPPDAVDTVRLEAKTAAGWRMLASAPVGADGSTPCGGRPPTRTRAATR